MKLIRVHIVSADTCGGFLDGLDIHLREPSDESSLFDPICLVGPNGSGKSQFLQVLAEIMQSIWHAVEPTEERLDGNVGIQFEIEYLIRPEGEELYSHIRVTKLSTKKRRKPIIKIESRDQDGWVEHDLGNDDAGRFLPQRICGYTSGDNETLSLPFLVSRSGYADEVGKRALDQATRDQEIPDTRLMLVDYGTNLEVLASNLLMGNSEQRAELLRDTNVDDLHSIRCVIQLAHTSHPKASKKASTGRKGIQLTKELETNIENIKACSSCFSHEERTDKYTFDFWINSATREAFGIYWESAISLYKSLHKLAMLNDLAIPKATRTRFRKETENRKFASRLPEPQDEGKVFRFEQVKFSAKMEGEVDYVSLSDGEHQLGQLLGTMLMQSKPNILFLLDEPESHFNPQWRLNCISRIFSLPTNDGVRSEPSSLSKDQECILTTHAPFVPCDIPRERVFIFSRIEGKLRVRRPSIETYGTAFDTILGECFDVTPPISKLSRNDVKQMEDSESIEEIEKTIERLGDSIQRSILIDRLLSLKDKKADL